MTQKLDLFLCRSGRERERKRKKRKNLLGKLSLRNI